MADAKMTVDNAIAALELYAKQTLERVASEIAGLKAELAAAPASAAAVEGTALHNADAAIVFEADMNLSHPTFPRSSEGDVRYVRIELNGNGGGWSNSQQLYAPCRGQRFRVIVLLKRLDDKATT